jgi:hypothetical protein
MFVFFGHHRCATTWTVTLILAFSRELGLRVAQEDRYEKVPADLTKIDFLTHSNATAGIVQQLAGQDYRAFHVIRDPRDILVSSYFSDKYSHYVYGQQFAQFREQLGAMEFDEGLRLELERRTAEFEALTRWDYHNPRVYETRYEVLTAAPFDEFSKILNFLGIPMPESGMSNRVARAKLAANRGLHRVGLPLRVNSIPPQWLRALLDKNSFQNIAGRQKGQEDQKSHYRKGVAGDWINYLTGANKELFKERWGQLVIDLGYEEDLDW